MGLWRRGFAPAALLWLLLGASTVATSELTEWLSGLGLTAYESPLRSEGFRTVEEVVAAQLGADDLKELGMKKMKDRKKLLAALSSHTGDASPPSSRTASAQPDPAAEEEDPTFWSRRASALDTDECTIDSISAADISEELFEARYRFQAPVRIRNMTHSLGWPAHERWLKASFLDKYGERRIVANTEYDKSGTVSRGGQSVKQYVASFAARHKILAQQQQAELSSAAAVRRSRKQKKREQAQQVQQYAFDRTFIEKHAPELRDDFSEIPVLSKLGNSSASAQPYLYLGPAESGLWFHRHGEAWNALVHGKKRWAMYPPGHQNPRMHTQRSPSGEVIGVEKWMHTVLPILKNTSLAPHTCVQEGGDVFCKLLRLSRFVVLFVSLTRNALLRPYCRRPG